MPAWLTCVGCGARVADDDVTTFSCPSTAPEVEHLLVRELDTALVPFCFEHPIAPDDNPFVRYRQRLLSYHRARAAGMTDADFVNLVEELDEAIFAVDARRFRVTPFGRHEGLARALGFADGGALWLKNETGNVSGSHKARHLMGIMLHLRWPGRLSLAHASQLSGQLAIASCGNAALAAAVVAAAAKQPLSVFIPPDADPLVKARLEALGASTYSCERRAGEVGDPCYLRFLEATQVAEGAIAFSCQGPDNGLTIEGGQCLAYEMVEQLDGAGLDDVVVQVGGAALASAMARSLLELGRSGALSRRPRLHCVQTASAFPLVRAYERLARRIEARLDGREPEQLEPQRESPQRQQAMAQSAALPARAALAGRISESFWSAVVQRELAEAALHRAQFMWPWENAPHSVAHGILDDETYDWYGVLKVMLETGGIPVVADEASLVEAQRVARSVTSVPVCATGASGLAGLSLLRASGVVPAQAQAAVIFTGVDRQVEAAMRAGA
jgi:threonine dehydratase